MTCHDRTVWPLAAGLAAMAGYVDVKLGGLFVSFMSGNTTRLAVGIVVVAAGHIDQPDLVPRLDLGRQLEPDGLALGRLLPAALGDAVLGAHLNT